MKYLRFSPAFARFAVTALCMALCLSMMAVPVEKSRRLVMMDNGTEMWVTPYGDETFSYLLSDDEYLVEPSVSNPHLFVKTQQRLEEIETQVDRIRKMSNGMRFVGDPSTAPLPSKGSPKVPVVLVNFTDSIFSVADTPEKVNAYFDLYCNGTKDGKLYQGHGSYGAVRDYFVQQSDSIFQPEFTIIGPVTLDHPESYYGTDGGTKDTRYNDFFKDAVTKATEIYSGNWSDFDNKGKGQVDMVFLIFAGCGQANGGDATTLWPRESMASVTVNNIKFATSACCNENRGVRKGGKVVRCEPDGIGVMCHELNHAMGMPDFYDTRSQKASFGMDLWSLMDYGCYASNGYQPCAFTAYEREFYGWRSIEILSKPGFVTLTSLEKKGGIAYKIVNDENPNEYYILENRQPLGWDMSAGYYGHGLQVTHVDYIPARWTSNTVNNVTDHQCMTILAANNRYIGTSISSSLEEVKKTWAGNLYPYINADDGTCNDSLTAHSVPAAKVYTTSGYMHKDINAIVENVDNTVSLYFGNDYQTFIQNIHPEIRMTDDCVYNLQGQPISTSALKTGNLYIKNGKKLLFKR